MKTVTKLAINRLRDRLRDGLSWIFPGPQKFFYE